MLVRAASTTTHTSAASSIIPVSNIEAQWETLNTKEQTEVYEQLLEAQKRDWKTLSIDEKKAGKCCQNFIIVWANLWEGSDYKPAFRRDTDLSFLLST